RDTASAVGEVSAEASQMAATVELLQRHVGAASHAGADAGDALRAVSDALARLHRGLSESGEPLERIGRAVGRLSEMLHALGKLAGRAQLLAVNAAIEAAHINGGGSRFDIVASEVRALAVSTRDAATEVRRIAVDLRTAADHVNSAAAASIAAVTTTGENVRRSGTTLAGAHRSIDELGESVTAIGSASSEQSAALETVAGSVEEIAMHAAAAKRATAEAGELRLEQLLAPAEERIRRWTFDPGSAASPATAAAGIDAYGTALGDLAAEVDADQRAVVADLTQLAVAVAYNAVAWRSVGLAHRGLRSETEQVRRTVGESTLAARSASDAAASMRALVASLKERYDDAMSSLDRGLAAIADVERAVADADGRVTAMTAAVQRTHEIVELIDAVSDDTVLLSLNAAIESSRAGVTGAGFSVIADEIRQLAGATQDVTASVSAVVSEIAVESELVRSAIGSVADGAAAVTAAATRVRSVVATLGSEFEETLSGARDVATAADGQVRGLERVLENATRSAAALGAQAASEALERRLELYALGDRAHHIAARRGVATETAEVRRFVNDAADRVEAVFEGVLRAGRSSPATFFDFTYDEVRGERIRELARLFDVSHVPAHGFDPPKFATRWDALVDEELGRVLDDALERAAFARPTAISVTDLNGFIYAYPRRLVAAWTGIVREDSVGNRVKRMLEDEPGLRMVRTGLGEGVAEVGRRAPYSAFERAGCVLERPPGERPWQLSVFARDLGDVINTFVVPIYVRGRRHGALRFGYDVEVL
ncbi:MAG: methyl-accepting chemotaxis protein, partial [Candidatus Eremiobacteraeota bacterium]|nr:methyl-accepting chemotaxis protein [Candidatus Eremiobacteraeota bacterium]